jgi:hypothetical protein
MKNTSHLWKQFNKTVNSFKKILLLTIVCFWEYIINRKQIILFKILINVKQKNSTNKKSYSLNNIANQSLSSIASRYNL